MADRPTLTLTCPCCRHSWAVPETCRKAILTELETWDRRYDRPEMLVEAVLTLVGTANREMEAEHSHKKTA